MESVAIPPDNYDVVVLTSATVSFAGNRNCTWNFSRDAIASESAALESIANPVAFAPYQGNTSIALSDMKKKWKM